MKKLASGIFCLLLSGAGLFLGSGQRTPQDIIRGSKVAPAAARQFIDAQLIRKSDDGLLQIVALRRGEPPQGSNAWGGGQTGGALWLWHAYQTPAKSWVSNGPVLDLSASLSAGARPGLKDAARAAVGNLRLTAASDASGRLHVVLVDNAAGGGFLYLLRDNDSRWRALSAETIPENPSEMCLVPHPEGNGVVLLGLAGGGPRLVGYSSPDPAISGAGGVRWARAEVPGELQAGAFAVSHDDRYFFFLLQTRGGEFRGAELHAASGKWLLEPQKFMRGFRDLIGGAVLESMSGFRDANGLMQVVGLAGGGVVHIYRDEIGTWYNNGVALPVPGLRRVSGDIDAQGLINVVGLTEDGRIWHGFRAENHQWRDNGVIFDARSD